MLRVSHTIACLRPLGGNLFLKIALQFIERCRDFSFRTAELQNVLNLALETLAAFVHNAENVIGGPEEAFEELKLLRKELIDAHVRRVAHTRWGGIVVK